LQEREQQRVQAHKLAITGMRNEKEELQGQIRHLQQQVGSPMQKKQHALEGGAAGIADSTVIKVDASSLHVWYGDPAAPFDTTRGYDVTTKALQLVQQRFLELNADNQQWGDPVPGTPKVLLLKFRGMDAQFNAEEEQTKQLWEHSGMTLKLEMLGDMTSPTTQDDMTSPKAQLDQESEKQQEKFAVQLKLLCSMGFGKHDTMVLCSLLETQNGDVSRVLEQLL